LRYGLAIGIGTQKDIARKGVFVRVVFAFKRSISCDSQTPSMIFTYLVHRKIHINQSMGPEKDFTKGGDAQKKQNANRK
jgi:hypothetical protein